MARLRAHDRLETLIDTATELFIQRGYRRTQMAEITTAMGLSPGAVYRYVESKEALFDLCIRAASAPDRPYTPGPLPLPTPPPGEMLAFVRQKITEMGRLPLLEAAAATDDCPDPRAELEGIARELYGTLFHYRRGIKLMDRCALDWPDLAALWNDTGGQGVSALVASYLDRRIAAGYLRPLPDIPTSARLFLEIVVMFAIHIHWHPYEMQFNVAEFETAVVDNLIHAYALP